MSVKSSFSTLASQLVNYNENILEMLEKFNLVATSNQSSVNINFRDPNNGSDVQYSIPSFGYLLSEINRLNNNLNTLYSIDTDGSLIQNADNKFKKIITVDLNREPNDINELNLIENFSAKKNWFFEDMMNPMLNVTLDLTGKVKDDVRKALVRRFLPRFEKTSNGELTQLGISAQESFDQNFRNNKTISYNDFIFWHRTTPGVINPERPNYDEEMYDLEPNKVLFDGIFSVLSVEEDSINNRLWYHLDTLDYIETINEENRELAEGDELIINKDNTSTRYRIIETSTASSNPRIRVELVEGLEPIPTGVGTLKIYSPVVHNKRIEVSIGYNERNVVFVKPMNANTHILAKNWGNGVGFWTNDLSLISETPENGKTMEQFYQERVFDYGKAIQDLVEKNVPHEVGRIPNTPTLIEDNFKVVQINKHLTDTVNSKELAKKHNLQKSVKDELRQLDEAIKNKNKELKITRFSNAAEKKKFTIELDKIAKERSAKTRILESTTNDIISQSSEVVNGDKKPKFRVRGFWDMPNPIVSQGSKPQEVVQFKVRYRYLSEDGSENQTETFKIERPTDDLALNAAFTNWEVILTDARKRVKNENNEWEWEIQDVADADTPNINQLDISIQKGEQVEIQVKSLSEVGWPDTPFESEWSEPIMVEFPEDLDNVLGENEFILREATQEELKVRIDNELEGMGLNEHLADQVTIENTTYMHDDKKILMTGARDETGNQISLFEYINKLERRIQSLEEEVRRTRGILMVKIFRNDEEFTVKNNEEISFNVECEDYLDPFQGNNVPTGRVYSNDIYVVKDFALQIENKAEVSPLGLLSNRSYWTNSDFLRTDAPQVFWVNERDELIQNTSTGQTRTQLDNQFLWVSNYTSIDQNTVVRLSDNISNLFISDGTNSLTPVLSSTEYNLGYNETTILNFNDSNFSLLEKEKWTDVTPSVASTRKLLTTVHPVIQNLENIVETNFDKVRSIAPGEENNIRIPINIYFKMNSLDPDEGTGSEYDYIDLNKAKTTVRHIKKVRFFLENEAENRPFIFSLRFNINRNKVGIQKITPNTRTVSGSRT